MPASDVLSWLNENDDHMDQSPVWVMQEYADQLTKKTKGRIRGHVDTFADEESGQVSIRLLAEVPALGRYRTVLVDPNELSQSQTHWHVDADWSEEDISQLRQQMDTVFTSENMKTRLRKLLALTPAITNQ